jgi:peptide/nickel transport system permease protein
MADAPVVLAKPAAGAARDRGAPRSILAYCRRNPQLVVGAAMLLSLVLIGLVGPLVVNVKHVQPMSAIPVQPPSLRYPLGTDEHGRNLLAVMVVGLPLTLRIGLLAGAVGVAIGAVLGFLAGYRGGVTDAFIGITVDILLTVPSLLVLITIAASIRGFITVEIMALVIALLAWRGPTRTIRAQVLTLRERAYVQVARLSGMSDWQVITRELMPNLSPYLAASFVAAVAYAVLASIGLEALGLGPQNDPTLGMTIYWAIYFNALLRGFWWWWLPPIVVLVVLFLGLFLLAAGFDELANPRLRRAA